MAKRSPSDEVSAGSSSQGRPDVVAWSCLWLTFVVGVLITFLAQPDDALITARIAWHLVHGEGPVFNSGERVQGFTSVLGMLVTAVVILLPGGFVLLKLKLASLAFGVGTLVVGKSLIDRQSLPRPIQLAVLFVVGASPILLLASANAMETSLAAFLTVVLLRALSSNRHLSSPLAVGVIGLGCALTRPDAIGVVAALALFCAAREPLSSALRSIRWALVAGVGVALVMGAQWWYFGFPFPNTYYAKDQAAVYAAKHGLIYLVNSLQLGADPTNSGIASLRGVVAVFLLAVVVVGFSVGTLDLLRRRSSLAVLPVAVIAQCVFIVQAGGDWIPRGRFLAPVILPLLCVMARGWATIATSTRSRMIRSGRWRVMVAALLVGSTGFGPWIPARYLFAASGTPVVAPIWASGLSFRDRDLVGVRDPVARRVWVDAVEKFRCARSGDTVAYSEMGYVPWARRDLTFVDTAGLVNERIAHDAPASMKTWSGVEDSAWWGSGSVVGAELLRRRPQLILVVDGSDLPQTVLNGSYRFDASIGAFVLVGGRCDVGGG